VSVLVAWTATACIGAALSAYLLVQALLDLQALGGVRNGRRWRVWGRILQEGIRLSIHVPFALLGFALLSQDIQPRLSFTVYVLLWGNLGLVVNSLVSVYVRRKADVPIDPELLKAAAALRMADLARLEQATRQAEAQERQADATERIADSTEASNGR
jgi:hypothetical protein